MKNIKSMLKFAADEQKIPELQDKILAKIDTSKVVRMESPIINYKKRFTLSNILIMSSIAAASILVGIGIGNIGKNDSKNPIIDEKIPPKIEDRINDDKPIDNVYEENIELFSSYMDSIFKQECFNIINIAPSLNNIYYDTVIPGEKYMSDSEMLTLSHDINSNIYILEDMLDKIDEENCLISDNFNQEYDYSKVIDIYGVNDYKIYYNEEILDMITIDNEIYKSKSNLNGLIVIGNDNYEFSGTMVYKNSTTTYTTTIIKDDNKIQIEEVFKPYLYRYTYNYSNISDPSLSKKILITQKLNYNFTTEEIEFDNSYNKLVIQTKNQKDDMHIFAKIKSKESDELYVYKLNNGYKYDFKNSSNEPIILIK